ncbi:unnamed protein product [Gadus morhua 'NCC']
MALRRDPGQRAHYQAHYAFIKAFQLPVGSSIMAACRLTYDSGSYVLLILGRRGQMSSHTSGTWVSDLLLRCSGTSEQGLPLGDVRRGASIHLDYKTHEKGGRRALLTEMSPQKRETTARSN